LRNKEVALLFPVNISSPNPQDLSIVAEEIAKLKQISVEKLITQCDNNAISLFRLS
jgi:TatD DNase family protein